MFRNARLRTGSPEWPPSPRKTAPTGMISSALVLRGGPPLSPHTEARPPVEGPPPVPALTEAFCLLHPFLLFRSVTAASLSPASFIPPHGRWAHCLPHMTASSNCVTGAAGDPAGTLGVLVPSGVPAPSWRERDRALITSGFVLSLCVSIPLTLVASRTNPLEHKG